MFCGEKFTIILREALPEASGNLRVFDYAIMRATDQVVTLRMRMGFGPIADTVRA